jgi:hypothetical protein
VIGVLCKPEQAAFVEEFFELFKTPWEFHRAGTSYDVVVTTIEQIPDLDAKLLVVYGAKPTSVDQGDRFVVAGSPREHWLSHRGLTIPIYGQMATCAHADGRPVTATTSGEIVGVCAAFRGSEVVRLGFDVFDEVGLLVTIGQPPERAHVPTLDLHICMLRDLMVGAGIVFVEIPPVPAGYGFAVCLTHDIDFVGIRQHAFDHSMWGFVYRSTVGAIRELVRGRLSVRRVVRMWRALASLPFVYLGWVRDFWEPFSWYLDVERNYPATYFLIPFKKRPGDCVSGKHAARRATAYDVGDIAAWTEKLQQNGCEVGVHGIDAWHSIDKGRDELTRVSHIAGGRCTGVRMHWLLSDARTAPTLEGAGYGYDSTAGYNETIGYRNGTGQVFRPIGVRSLLELPMHIQDGALFYPNRLDLSEPEAAIRCKALIDNAKALGGTLTVLWHDRSHGPERFWGDFYVELIRTIHASGAWFAVASDVVGWFRSRRTVRFDISHDSDGARISVRYDGRPIAPPLTVRIHGAGPRSSDVAWDGKSSELSAVLSTAPSATYSGASVAS